MTRTRRRRTRRTRAHLIARIRSTARARAVLRARSATGARPRGARDLREILKFQDHSGAVIGKVRLTNAAEPAFVFKVPAT